jgi:hypothetical protein
VVPESVRLATTVGDLQADVFIEGSALDRFPTITFRRRRPHCAFPVQSDGGSIRRVGLQSKTAADDYQHLAVSRHRGLSGVFTLIQSRDAPDRRRGTVGDLRRP